LAIIHISTIVSHKYYCFQGLTIEHVNGKKKKRNMKKVHSSKEFHKNIQ
jgi:hypothetical protein